MWFWTLNEFFQNSASLRNFGRNSCRLVVPGNNRELHARTSYLGWYYLRFKNTKLIAKLVIKFLNNIKKLYKISMVAKVSTYPLYIQCSNKGHHIFVRGLLKCKLPPPRPHLLKSFYFACAWNNVQKGLLWTSSTEKNVICISL